MLARALSYTTVGLEALPVEVEVDASRGLPGLTIVGLPDQAVREAKERVRAAILNSQYRLPAQRLTVNLAPADLKKVGGVFDLAIALGILAVSDQLDPQRLADCVVLGELALDGSVRPTHGTLPIALALKGCKKRLLLPEPNVRELAFITGVRALPISSLQDALDVLTGARIIPAHKRVRRRQSIAIRAELDFAEVKGQAHAKRALEVAVAGGHHALLIGPPGSGKTMLASRVPTIQPPLSSEEALETSAIHSVAGLLHRHPLVLHRPFRAPHHTSSAVALVGGNTTPQPGEVSLAHHGVLFLDELPEFHRNVLESLRQPLEDGYVTIARAKRTVSFPARFMLVGAMNPCPCGYLTDPRGRCRCPSTRVSTYLAKLSGPLLDRIDLHIEVPALPFGVLTTALSGESSATMRARIQQAMRFRRRRGQSYPNAQLRGKALKLSCLLTPQARRVLHAAMQNLGLSARSYDKILKISRTIADLTQSEQLQPNHVAEAIQYRSLDRQLWASDRHLP